MMRGTKLKYVAVILALSLLFLTDAKAQMFATPSEEKASSVVDKPSQKNNSSDWGRFYNQASSTKNTKEIKEKESEDKKVVPAKTTKAPAKQEVENPEDYIYKNVPQIDRPTLDGVKRGRTSVYPVVADGKVKAEGYIYVFYSDFSVSNMMNGTTTCDVKFQILTTLDRRLNTLAMRLKWPDMETPLTFIDVNPNQEYHLVYTLLGDGCYSMDKIPNIVINRCRVKGMTQEECARKVRWIRKV